MRANSSAVEYEQCICQTCDRQYDYRRNRGGTRQKCNSCSVNERRFKIKKQIIAYLDGACNHCGYNRCDAALVPHHIDPSIKSFRLSGAHSRSWANIEKELDKCMLLCQNCHAEEHHNHDRAGCLVGVA